MYTIFLKDLQEQLKGVSQERDEHKIKVESFENHLKTAAEERVALDKEFSDTKEELQAVKNHLAQLKENLQVEQKKKEVC